MKIAALVLAILSGVGGLVASIYWYRSAIQGPAEDIIGNYVRGEDGHTPIGRWANEVACRNRTAAAWTGVSVLLSALSAICGALAG